MNRREFLYSSLAVAGLATSDTGCAPSQTYSGSVPAFELDELGVAALQDGMKSGRFTAHSLTEKYLGRIDAIDRHGPLLRSVIELNPDALSIADAWIRSASPAASADRCMASPC